MAHAWAPQHCAGAEMMAHTLARSVVDRGTPFGRDYRAQERAEAVDLRGPS